MPGLLDSVITWVSFLLELSVVVFAFYRKPNFRSSLLSLQIRGHFSAVLPVLLLHGQPVNHRAVLCDHSALPMDFYGNEH